MLFYEKYFIVAINLSVCQSDYGRNRHLLKRWLVLTEYYPVKLVDFLVFITSHIWTQNEENRLSDGVVPMACKVIVFLDTIWTQNAVLIVGI